MRTDDVPEITREEHLKAFEVILDRILHDVTLPDVIDVFLNTCEKHGHRMNIKVLGARGRRSR